MFRIVNQKQKSKFTLINCPREPRKMVRPTKVIHTFHYFYSCCRIIKKVRQQDWRNFKIFFRKKHLFKKIDVIEKKNLKSLMCKLTKWKCLILNTNWRFDICIKFKRQYFSRSPITGSSFNWTKSFFIIINYLLQKFSS